MHMQCIVFCAKNRERETGRQTDNNIFGFLFNILAFTSIKMHLLQISRPIQIKGFWFSI